MSKGLSMSVLPKIAWPVPSNNRGTDFASQDDVMSHLDGEATGWYLLGSNGMWHGGIHITSTTTPWCALSGKAASEVVDFSVAYKGEQAVRCMADGEVVAYRVCQDYLDVPWETGPLNISGSFVLVRHYIQPGEKKESGLHFYTLYMHLAPYSAYSASESEIQWIVNDNLTAYSPEWVMSASTDNKGISDSYRVATLPKGAHVEWDAIDNNRHTIGHNDRRYGLVTFKGLSDKAKAKGTKTSLQEGQQYWTLTDKNNLVPSSGAAARPSWWAHLLPPFAEPMQFDRVVCPTPYPISAGDSIGHLGYFQIPKDGGYIARYQVHIECLSMDDNLEAFLKNSEKVGENTPLYLKCPTGLPLFSKDLKTKAIASNGRTSQGEAILKLSQVKTETDAQKQEYWFLPYANGYVPKSNKSAETLSRYDLEKLGFTTTVDEAPSFDHLDGKTPPKGLVRRIYDRLFEASSNDTRVTHRIVPHNYQRLLNRIDGNISPYSPQEYLSAIHNPSYRDVKSKMIVKHPSEWYHKKDDPIWLPFLNGLTKDAPEWKAYSEAHIEKLAWMQDASKLKLGPSLWHMHPVIFLTSLMFRDENIKVLRLRAFLRMIRIGEGTTIDDGYRTMFTGVKFTDFTRHPNVRNEANGIVSTAAGAYQFLYNTWRSLHNKFLFSDFSPHNQDLGCIALIAGRKALVDVMNGKISEAIHLCRVEWASLPGSPHGQPTVDKEMIMKKYEHYFVEEKQGKSTLHATTEEIEKFIETYYPETL
jgi:muramidase (phage lysozyme)